MVAESTKKSIAFRLKTTISLLEEEKESLLQDVRAQRRNDPEKRH
jgi:hypothetical protein